MSDFGFLNEHTIPNAEMANVLRAVYSHASNAEKYYTISSEKCISYIRELLYFSLKVVCIKSNT